MFIDNLNLNNLRVFECVFRLGCMTTAAKELHLTQSGVSQHMKALEESLGISLFDRINKKIIPTEMGEKLYKNVTQSLGLIEEVVSSISSRESEIKSAVRIGMPIEFGNHVLIPMLAKIGQEFTGIRFDMILDFASVIEGQLLTGELDFAFVDDYKMDKKITSETVAEEVFHLCASREYIAKHQPVKYTKSYFESLNYISYQVGEPVIRKWMSHHLKRRNMKLDVRAQVMDVRSVARFVVNHAGVGIIPNFLLNTIKEEGYEIFNFKGKAMALTNKIQLVYLKNKTHKSSSVIVMDELRKSFKKGITQQL